MLSVSGYARLMRDAGRVLLLLAHLTRNCFSRAIVSLGISLRCGLLVCSYLTVAGITRVRGLLSGAQRPDAIG
jgi:hypothetical protein